MAKQTKPRRPPGYWDDEANIERELRGLIQKYGKFPSFGTMVREGESALCNAVSKGRKISYWRAKLGQVLPQKPAGFWTEEAVERALREWIAENGTFPSCAELTRAGRHDLLGALMKHGGTSVWQSKLRVEKASKWSISITRSKASPRSSYWKNAANVEAELRRWIQEQGRFPTMSDLRRSRHSSLAAAMSRTLGIPAWRTRLGYPAIASRPGYWQDEANIERELRQLIEALGRFPTSSEANAHGKASLFGAMRRVRGIDYWRDRVQHVRDTKKPGYWLDEANIERELRAWIQKYGRFPKQDDLAQTGHSSLNNGMTRTATYAEWRVRLGLAVGRVGRGYWQDEANVERELRRVVAKLGRFPSDVMLLKMGETGVRAAIIHHPGRTAYWRAKLGYGPITPAVLRVHADVLARVVLALNVADTTSFWSALLERWTMRELTEAIREFVEENMLEQFNTLLLAAG